MKITKISKLKDHRIFRDFSWPRDLPDFARYNVIYGWNGSGKTTLSSLFGLIEHRKPMTEGKMEIEIDNHYVVSGDSFGTAALPSVRVFNREFMEKTIAAIHNDSVDPISIIIGEKKVEDIKILEEKKIKLQSCAASLESVETSLSSEEKAYSTFLTKGAKVVKDGLLRFNAPQYATYNKQRFESTLHYIKSLHGQVALLDESTVTKLQAKASQQPKAPILFAPPALPNLDQLREQVVRILKESVVSKTIDELVQNPKLSEWVQTGLALHCGENHSDKCHFCGNPLSLDRKKQLEAHFNDSVKAFQNQIASLLAGINQYQTRLSEAMNRLPHRSQFYDDLGPSCENIVLRIKETTVGLSGRLQLYAEYLRKKRENLFQSQVCNLTKDDDDAVSLPLRTAFEELSNLVKRHAQKTNTLSADCNTAVQALERNMVLGWVEEYNNRLSSIKSKQNDKTTLEKTRDELNHDISVLETSLIEKSKAADELNKDLHAYLGRDEISFAVTDGQLGYRLLRNGQPAANLSEGEQSAIAFLYFLRSLTDRNFDLTQGIVVIDDPVSSLDSNSLFSAFSFMKTRVENCKQLFVLTHNFVLFRQIANWFHHLKGQNKDDLQKRPARFYMQQTRGSGLYRQSSISKIDPLLEEFESEYHYLFKRVFELVSTDSDELASLYEVPNIARRILEIFLAYQVPCHANGLRDQISATNCDSEKKTVLLRLLNICSHGEGIRDPEHDPTALCEAKKALKYMLELIQTLNKSHYDGMVALIQSSSAEQIRPQESCVSDSSDS